MKRHKIGILGFIAWLATSCNSADFGSGQRVSTQDNPASTSKPSDAPGSPTTVIPAGAPTSTIPGTGGPLELDEITDKLVNTGEKNKSYSETLWVVLPIHGGEGDVKISVTTSTQSPQAGLTGANFVWVPGYMNGSTYVNEAGQHSVTVSASDSKGQTAQRTFNVVVLPVGWKSISLDAVHDVDMVTDFEVRETLHPNRSYSHVNTINGEKLQSQTCISFKEGGPTITLQEEPSIIQGQTTTEGNTRVFPFKLTYKLPKEQQPYEKSVFVTWLNFTPNPAESVSASGKDQAKNMEIYFGFARCRDGIVRQDECKKAALTAPGLENYFYCSEHFNNPSDKYKELKSYYCGFAKLNGVPAPGC